MGYIYRYQLRDKCKREQFDLLDYEKSIIDTISLLFNENMKDVRVEKKFFEFKLYESVENKTLRRMGSELAKFLKINGFVRMEQKFYVIVYPNEDTNIESQYIEFFDFMDFNDIERFSKQARNYTKKHMKTNEYMKTNEFIIENTKLHNAFYVDILSAFIKVNNKIFLSEKEITYFMITGYHRVRDKSNFEKEKKNHNIVEFNKEIDFKYLSYIKKNLNYNEHIDYFDINNLKEIENKEEVSKIISNIEYEISETKQIKYLDCINARDKLVFTVYNVGQGLATSLSKNEETFLYFDFGMSYGENSFNIPSIINMDVMENSTIILSHIHRDHWIRLIEEINAFKCNWYIPDQDSDGVFKHRFAEIIIAGGSVHKIKHTINFQGGNLCCNGISRHKPDRCASYKHGNGISLRLKMKKEDKSDINILIPGDQQYDYIDSRYTDNIDVLVASHHGGEYSWSSRRDVFNDIPTPRNKKEGIIIYSYGISNTYSHPSKSKDYTTVGWTKEHHTPVDGEYILNLTVK